MEKCPRLPNQLKYRLPNSACYLLSFRQKIVVMIDKYSGRPPHARRSSHSERGGTQHLQSAFFSLSAYSSAFVSWQSISLSLPQLQHRPARVYLPLRVRAHVLVSTLPALPVRSSLYVLQTAADAAPRALGKPAKLFGVCRSWHTFPVRVHSGHKGVAGVSLNAPFHRQRHVNDPSA